MATDYSRRILVERVPVAASIELTMRCNLHCAHCYCPPGDRGRELDTDEIKGVFDRMAEMGTLFLLMTGGDPLLRKDFPTLYSYAKERGMLVTVYTNGTLVTDEIAELWEALPPHQVEISLYGLTREVYEKVVGVKGSYDRCLAGIGRVLEGGHELALKCPVTRQNAHEIAGVAQLAKDLGVEFRYDPLILATMEGEQHPHALRLSADEVVALEASDVEKDRAWRQYLTEDEHPKLDSQRLFSCAAGRNFLHVDACGNVQVCLMVKNFKRSLREKSLERIYHDDFPEILSTRRDQVSSCGDCAHRSTCDNCPGVALWETRRSDSQVDFACRLSELRAKRYGGAAVETRREAVADGCASGARARRGGYACDEQSTLVRIGG